MTKTSIRLLVLLGVLTLAVAALTRPGAADATTHNVAMLDRDRRSPQRDVALAAADDEAAHADELQRARDDEHHLPRVDSLALALPGRSGRTAGQDAAAAGAVALHPPARAQPAAGLATRTGNGYYGGLQMDIEFQRMYGADLLRRKGTADRWTPIEQIWVAERAYRSGRGFYPWPNTARSCGLI